MKQVPHGQELREYRWREDLFQLGVPESEPLVRQWASSRRPPNIPWQGGYGRKPIFLRPGSTFVKTPGICRDSWPARKSRTQKEKQKYHFQSNKLKHCPTGALIRTDCEWWHSEYNRYLAGTSCSGTLWRWMHEIREKLRDGSLCWSSADSLPCVNVFRVLIKNYLLLSCNWKMKKWRF